MTTPTTMTTTDTTGRRVSIRTGPSLVGLRLMLTVFPRKAWAGGIEKASAHLALELTPGQVRELIAGLAAYLCNGEAAEAGDRAARVPVP